MTKGRARNRIGAIAVAFGFVLVAIATASRAYEQNSTHSLSIGYSQLEVASQIPLDHMEYIDYRFQSDAPADMAALGYSTSVEDGMQESPRIYRLHRDFIDIVDNLDLPLNSESMQIQVLEALEGKVPVRYFAHGSDGTGCAHCQAIVVMDLQSREVSMLGINNHQQNHQFQLVVEHEDNWNVFTQSTFELQQEARLEEALTEDELDAISRRQDTDVQILERIVTHTQTERRGQDKDALYQEEAQNHLVREDQYEDANNALSEDVGVLVSSLRHGGANAGLAGECAAILLYVPNPDIAFVPVDDNRTPDRALPDSTPEPPDHGSGTGDADVPVDTGQDTGPPGDGGLGAEPPDGDDPGAEPPGGDDPGAEPPGGDDPGAEPPGGDDPGAEPPGGDDPGAGPPGGDPGAEPPGGDDPGAEPPGGDDPGAEPPGGDDPGAELPGGDDADAETPNSEVSGDVDSEDDIQVTYRAIVVNTEEGNPEQAEESEIMELAVPGSGLALTNFRLRLAYAYEQDSQGYNLIRNAEELDAVRTELDGKFRVVNDIDLTGYSSAYFTAQNGWIGIGKPGRGDMSGADRSLQPFTGEFDGGGYLIEGLWCNYTDSGSYINSWHSHQGLFGFTQGAYLYNCNILLEREMTAVYQIGGLVGTAHGGTVIENCTVTGGPVTVTDGGYAGGLAGLTNDPRVANISRVTIRDCSVIGVDGKPYRTSGNYAGGLVGMAYMTEVVSCRTENVTVLAGGDYSGGLIGGLHGESLVEDCHVEGVTSTAELSYAGGAFGCIYTVGNAGIPSTETIVKDSTVEDAVVTVNSLNYVGGFAGVIYQRSIVSGCSVENLNVKANSNTGYGIGGFTGIIHDYSAMTDCYAANGTVTGKYYQIGGLAGIVSQQVVLTNCYAQVDVISTRSSGAVGVGGLVGYYDGNAQSSISNSYATGSVTANSGAITHVGGLIGWRYYATAGVTNCYSTGTVRVAPSSSYIGGLIGQSETANLNNCYYDTTTTRRDYAIGGASMNTGSNPAGTTALTTTQMVAGTGAAGTYINFAYEDTELESGHVGSPWYIDEEYTYPYLYYQYNGYSAEERNYNLAGVRYASGAHLGKLRKDFSIEDTVPFAVTSAGARRAYFPYTGVSNYSISADTPTSVPSSAFVADSGLYSLGGISATNIVAFASMPQAVKSSDRPVYVDLNPATYTYVGDEVMYQIEIANHSTEFDWHDVVLSDPLPAGVTLAEESVVTVQYGGAAETPIQKGSGTIPYYTYNDVARTLSVYLGSLYIPDSAVGASTVTVRFVAALGEAALSEQPLVQGADHIRNRGTVSGWMEEPDGGVPFEYETGFDDYNTDPVFTIRVTYDRNGPATGTEPVDPVLYRNGDEVTVLGKEDLEWPGKLLLGWSPDREADPTDQQAIIYAPGDTFPIGYDDVTLYAVWVEQVQLTFYKVDAKDTSVKLPGARFSLFQCTDGGHTGPADHGVPRDAVSCWFLLDDTLESDASAQFLVNAPIGIPLALVEDMVPDGYALPQGYWVFAANADGTLEGPQGVGYVPGISKAKDPGNPDATWYLVTNVSHMDLPLTGGNYLLSAIGAFCLLFGGLSLRVARRRGL